MPDLEVAAAPDSVKDPGQSEFLPSLLERFRSWMELIEDWMNQSCD